jgi:hypothetical protein
MQEGEPRHTLEKRHDRGTGIETVVVGPPRLQRAAGHVKPLGCLALGDLLSMPCAVSCPEGSAFEARPALVAIIVATGLCLDYRCQSYLPTEAPTMSEVEGSGWRGSFLVAIPLSIKSFVCGRQRDEMADAVIEAMDFTIVFGYDDSSHQA